MCFGVWFQGLVLCQGFPVVPLLTPFLLEGSRTKTDYRKRLQQRRVPLFKPLYWRTWVFSRSGFGWHPWQRQAERRGARPTRWARCWRRRTAPRPFLSAGGGFSGEPAVGGRGGGFGFSSLSIGIFQPSWCSLPILGPKRLSLYIQVLSCWLQLLFFRIGPPV